MRFSAKGSTTKVVSVTRRSILTDCEQNFRSSVVFATGDFPDAFAVFNNTQWTCYRARWENTPEKQLKKMVKQFRKNLKKVVTLTIDRKLSEVMMSYLMFSIIAEMPNSDGEEGGQAPHFVGLHQVAANGTGGTMFPNTINKALRLRQRFYYI